MQCKRPGFDPCVKNIPQRREWQPTPVFLPGKFQGQTMGLSRVHINKRLTLTFFQFPQTKKVIVGQCCRQVTSMWWPVGMEKVYTVSKNKTRNWLWFWSWILIDKFKLKLKKVGKTTRPSRDDLNQISYDYTMEQQTDSRD